MIPAAGLGLLLAAPVSVSAQTNLTVRKLFQAPEGIVPTGAPADGKDGALYGVTAGGGTSNMGTVFMLRCDSSCYATLGSFVGTNGTTPYTALAVTTNGTLFGTTHSGGQYGFGTVFKINKNGSGLQGLHDFAGGTDSKTPSGALIEGSDGALYGMTSFGDSATRGTIFKIGPGGSGYAVIHTFTGNPDGQQPQGRLLQASDGMIYGTAYYGGSASVPGVVFRLDTNGNNYEVVHIFGGSGDGRNPGAGVTEGSDGMLYGTTTHGGTAAVGVVFQMSKDGIVYNVLRSFLSTGNDGQAPNSELAEGPDGVLYGTTAQGGANGAGTAFKIAKDGGGYAILHQFGSPGLDPSSPTGLSWGSDGVLYGSAQYGGSAAGCVFALTVTPLPPRVVSLSVGSSSNVIVCATTSAVQYEVQRSTNLSSWSVLTTLTSLLNGQLTNIDLSPPTAPAYYRLHQH